MAGLSAIEIFLQDASIICSSYYCQSRIARCCIPATRMITIICIRTCDECLSETVKACCWAVHAFLSFDIHVALPVCRSATINDDSDGTVWCRCLHPTSLCIVHHICCRLSLSLAGSGVESNPWAYSMPTPIKARFRYSIPWSRHLKGLPNDNRVFVIKL